ncbi:hypothetical protein PR202_gb04658 [Eleusine coracana subsp. coracana]|uniref:X8 domain-containing protein n=1 Tax=Eleusine coracana subsp. coracana TaxID=191504 RepID=A0AAV5E2L9_ELECO|nr:hypothetical protein PR202_gb04658 [Eleusine coracana subsp. coracana]
MRNMDAAQVLAHALQTYLTQGSWCVCRSDATDTALQKTLDYACGHGADCGAVLPSGPCYSPVSVRAHCSYAANSYYQQNTGAKGATCDFGGTANLTDTDPSSGTCKYPASASEAGTSTTNTTSPGASSSPGSTSNPATPSTGGSFTTPVGAFGPAPSTISAATAAAFVGSHVVRLLAVASVIAFLVR